MLVLATNGGERVDDDDAGVVRDAELMFVVVESVVLLMNRTMGVRGERSLEL